MNADLPIPAAIATRTAFDRATELLQIDPAKAFDAKLNELICLGKISTDERDTLAVLIDAGSAAAHRGWKPKVTELDVLVSIIEAFLHRTFVLGEAAKSLKQNVPSPLADVKTNLRPQFKRRLKIAAQRSPTARSNTASNISRVKRPVF